MRGQQLVSKKSYKVIANTEKVIASQNAIYMALKVKLRAGDTIKELLNKLQAGICD